jgi:hypothetical protein
MYRLQAIRSGWRVCHQGSFFLSLKVSTLSAPHSAIKVQGARPWDQDEVFRLSIAWWIRLICSKGLSKLAGGRVQNTTSSGCCIKEGCYFHMNYICVLFGVKGMWKKRRVPIYFKVLPLTRKSFEDPDSLTFSQNTRSLRGDSYRSVQNLQILSKFLNSWLCCEKSEHYLLVSRSLWLITGGDFFFLQQNKHSGVQMSRCVRLVS